MPFKTKRKSYTKDDVQSHGHGNPAVNVKIYKSFRDVKLPLHMGSSYPTGHPELISHSYTDDGFTHDWIESWCENNQDSANAIWDMCCIDGYEQAKDLAKDLFGPFVEVWAEGRSGGWLEVEGLPPVEGWDAVALGQWRKFEKHCRLLADDIPYQFVTSVYLNDWEEA